MSYYIKINDWLGDDREDVIPRFAKVFRISEDDAEEAVDQILLGLPWFFDRTISSKQRKTLETYLTKLGFEVEISSTAFEGSGVSSGAKTPSEISKLGIESKSLKHHSPIVKVALAVVLLIGIGFGLLQISFVKDLLKGLETPEETSQVAPVQPQTQPHPKPQAEPQAQAQPEPKKEEKPQPPADIKPLEGIAFEGKPTNEYPSTLTGCGGPGDINFKLLSSDLGQTQKNSFCKGNTIANPIGEWKCEFKPDSNMCQGKESYNCVRRYQCIPETPDFNRIKFKQEMAGLDNRDIGIQVDAPRIETFSGMPVDSKDSRRTTTSFSGCFLKEDLNNEFRRYDLMETQKDVFCKNNTIANPVADWKCEPAGGICMDNEEKRYNCSRSYQCIPETPDYNRAKFKQALKNR